MKPIEPRASRPLERGCKIHSKIPAAALEPKFLKNVLVITPEAADGATVQ
jgi:hypothetical protein